MKCQVRYLERHLVSERQMIKKRSCLVLFVHQHCLLFLYLNTSCKLIKPHVWEDDRSLIQNNFKAK